MVRVTKADRRAIEMAAPEHVENVQRYFFGLLTDDELDTLAAAFDRALENPHQGRRALPGHGSPDALRTSARGGRPWTDPPSRAAVSIRLRLYSLEVMVVAAR
jgi:hypothetical protein